MTNLGIVGSQATTDWQGSQFYNPNKLALSLPADVVFIELGENDARATIAPATIQTAIATIVAAHQALGRDVILLTQTPPNSADSLYPLFGPLINVAYNLADTYNIPVVDFNAVYQTWAIANAAGLMYDSLHDNETGYETCAQILLGALGV
jgi:lysophospholipase L1-like esterase